MNPNPTNQTPVWGENLYEYDAGSGDYNSPYRFNGKELDPETGNYYYGARYYDPKISVWLSVDRLAEKYPSMSPYVFSGNNPINLFDPNGDSINLAMFQLFDSWLGTDLTETVVSDLTEITGLDLNVDDTGMLTYGEAINTEGTSVDARNFLKEAIDNKNTVTVGLTQDKSSYAFPNGFSASLNIGQILSFVNGVSGGLNPKTMGFGMTLLHELDHTIIGSGDLDGGNLFGHTGPVVDRMNKIRRQMGSDWGQRMSYGPKQLGDKRFIPFDTQSRTFLTGGIHPIHPVSKFIKW